MRARFPAPPPSRPISSQPRPSPTSTGTPSATDHMDTTPVGDQTMDSDAGLDINGPLPAHQYYALTHVLQQISQQQASLDGTTRAHLHKVIDQLGAPASTPSSAAESGVVSHF